MTKSLLLERLTDDASEATSFPVVIGVEDSHLSEPVVTVDDLTDEIELFWELLELRLECY